jgi:hypothetical protein
MARLSSRHIRTRLEPGGAKQNLLVSKLQSETEWRDGATEVDRVRRLSASAKPAT